MATGREVDREARASAHRGTRSLGRRAQNAMELAVTENEAEYDTVRFWIFYNLGLRSTRPAEAQHTVAKASALQRQGSALTHLLLHGQV